MKISILVAAVLLVLAAVQGEAEEKRVLLPVVFDAPVSTPYGDVWESILTVHSHSSKGSMLNPAACSFLCVGFRVQSGHTVTNPPLWFPGGEDTSFRRLGRMIFVQHDDADRLSVNLQLLNRRSGGPFEAVDIPVIPEDEFQTGTANILAVTTDARVRHTLRIYDLTGRETEFVVRIYEIPDYPSPDPAVPDALIATTFVRTAQTRADPVLYPPMAIIDRMVEALALPKNDKVRIQIEPLQPTEYWAMVSMTDEQTSRILISTIQDER